MTAYRCPRVLCQEEFDTADDRHDHLVRNHGESYARAEPFDHTTDCSTNPHFTNESGHCEYNDPCRLRCHIRFLEDRPQHNDPWAEQELNASWHHHYDAHPEDEAADRAAGRLRVDRPAPEARP